MISLKKNDKIIIIAAIAVIVIAGVGIAAYTPDTSDNLALPMNNENQFTITWKTTTDNLETHSGMAPKDSAKQDTFTINQVSIKSITLNMSWVDDKTTLLKRFGLDTLQLKVIDPNGDEYKAQAQSQKKTRAGKVSITIPVLDRMPSTDVITANSSSEAIEIVKSDHSDEKFSNQEFQIEVRCSIGEKRFIKKLLEQGNSYKIDITYDYYEPSAMEEMNSNENNDMFNDLRGENYKPPFLSMIIGTGCGRYI